MKLSDIDTSADGTEYAVEWETPQGRYWEYFTTNAERSARIHEVTG